MVVTSNGMRVGAAENVDKRLDLLDILHARLFLKLGVDVYPGHHGVGYGLDALGIVRANASREKEWYVTVVFI